MLTNPLRVMVLTASTRPGAVGPSIARWFLTVTAERARQSDVELVSVSLAELALPFVDEEAPWSGSYAHPHTRRWADIVGGVDGIIAVTPEYNYSMPASLKNALDFLGPEWAWKSIGFVSYGNTSAGTRSVQHAKQAVTTLRLVPVGATVALRLADRVADGVVLPDRQVEESAVRLLDEIAALSRALRPMRRAMSATEGPLPGTVLRQLGLEDAPELAVLTRASWVDEAMENASLDIAALREDMDDVADGIDHWRTWGLWSAARLIGTVRTRRAGTLGEIGRLAVAVDVRGLGLGSWLLEHAERTLEQEGATMLELHTGTLSRRNIAMYQSRGYEMSSSSDPAVVTLRRPVATLLAAGTEV